MSEPVLAYADAHGIKVPCAFFDGKPVFPAFSAELNILSAALVTAQAKFGRAKKERDNTFFKSAYADLSSVLDACMPALAEAGFSVIQPVVAVAGEAYLITRLLHKSGEWLQASFPLTTLDSIKNVSSAPPEPASAGLGTGGEEGKKKKAPGVQALGSEITYMRRYCLASLVCIAADDDDDGNAAQQHQQSRPAPSAAQASTRGLGSLGR